MRGLVLLLGLLAASAGAAAQADALPKVRVEVAPFAAPLAPLQGLATTIVTVTVDCALLVTVSPGAAEVNLSVTDAPAWTSATVSPDVAFLSASECRGANTTFVSQLLASTSAEAPAFTPAEIGVLAATKGATPATAEASTSVQAGYFALLDVNLPESIVATRPGSAVACRLEVANLGNGATLVEAAVAEAPDGWSVRAPAPVTLEARQQGGTATSATLDVEVRPPDGGPLTNEVGAVNVVVKGTYALDPSLPGAETTQSCLVTSRALEAPSAAFAGIAALAAAALARARAARPTR